MSHYVIVGDSQRPELYYGLCRPPQQVFDAVDGDYEKQEKVSHDSCVQLNLWMHTLKHASSGVVRSVLTLLHLHASGACYCKPVALRIVLLALPCETNVHRQD